MIAHQSNFVNFFRSIGYDLSFFIVTQCSLIYKNENKFILLSGTVNTYLKTKKNQRKLFLKCKNISFESFTKYKHVFFDDIANTKKDYNKIINEKVKKIKTNCIFRMVHKSLENKKVTKFIETEINKNIVSMFLIRITKRLLNQIFDKYNHKILQSKIKTFCKLQKKESINRTELVRYFKITKLKIFKNNYKYKKKALENFLFNFFQFLNSIINVYFYVTESTFSGNKYFFFVKSHWENEYRKFANEFVANFEYVGTSENYQHTNYVENIKKNYDKNAKLLESPCNKISNIAQLRSKSKNYDIEKYKDVSINNMEHSYIAPKLRIIPKKSGFRPIINLSCKNAQGISPNNTISTLFSVLKSETSHCFNQETNNRTKIINKMINSSEYINDFFALKIDIKGCFDCIPHNKLQNITNKLLNERLTYLRSINRITNIQKYSTNDCKNDVIKSKINMNEDNEQKMNCNKENHRRVKKHIPHNQSVYITKNDFYIDNDKLPYNKFIDKYGKYNCINVQGAYQILNNKTLKIQLHNSVYNNVININNKIYKQKCGIPQGSILSTLLCNLYLNDIENKYLSCKLQNGNIFRFVDDFLVVSTKKEEIYDFLKIGEELKEYGININYEKLESSFDLSNFETYRNNKKLEELYNNLALCRKTKLYNWKASVYTNQINKLKQNIEKKRMSKEHNEHCENDKYYKNKTHTKYITWCGTKIYNGYSIKHDYINCNKNFIFFTDVNPGEKLKNSLTLFLERRLLFPYICYRNKMRLQNLYECFLFYNKRIMICVEKMPFVNKIYIRKLLDMCKKVTTSIFAKYKLKYTEVNEKIRKKAIKNSIKCKTMEINKTS
ncbi:hypothetical protein BDAP_000261 [Binucleata daphniae]